MAKILDQWTVSPHGPLVEVDQGILTVEGEIVMPLGRFPRRMTVVALESGGTLIWSAVALREPEMQRIEALGTPRFMIVPNQGHRLDARIWKKRYPAMQVIGTPRGREAIAEAVQVDATHDIVDDPAIDLHLIDGTKLDEFALHVRRLSGTTLVINDTIANVQRPHGIGAWFMTRLFGFGAHGPRMSRPVRRMLVEDGKALADQLRGWAAIPGLIRIIVSHGDVIEADPAAALRKVADSLD